MRRFEFNEGTSHKFWEVSFDKHQLTVRFGKVGTEGQTKSKPFASLDAVMAEAEKLIAEKLRKGYVEVTAAREARPGAPKPAPASTPATRVLLRDPFDGEELVVMLAGKRVAQGKGEAREVQAFASAKAAKEHFERILFLKSKRGYVTVETTQVPAEQAEAGLEDVVPDFNGTFQVSEGRCTITFEGEDNVAQTVCTALVKRLEKEAPRSVQLLCDFASPKQAWTRALQGATLPSLKAFIFDTHFQTQTRQGRNSVGDLAAVLAACPNLERLFATGDLTLSPTRHESLRELYLLGDPLSQELLAGLGGCEFPHLERLAVSLASDARAPAFPAVLQALRSLRAPVVREVFLDGLDRADTALELLAAEGLPPNWKVLSLRGGWGIDDDPDDVRALLQRHASALGGLEQLGLPSDIVVEGWPENMRPVLKSCDRFLPAGYSEW